MNPFIKNTTVSAKLIDHGRTKKILVYKKKRRKGYERKNIWQILEGEHYAKRKLSRIELRFFKRIRASKYSK